MMNATARMCELAEAAQSVVNCASCTWWTRPSSYHQATLDHPKSKPTTAWFMCVNRPYSNRTAAFAGLVQAAVMSAKVNAPSLAPFVLYMHSDGQQFGEDDALSLWLKAQGVRVVHSRLSFAHLIPKRRWRMKTLTGICK